MSVKPAAELQPEEEQKPTAPLPAYRDSTYLLVYQEEDRPSDPLKVTWNRLRASCNRLRLTWERWQPWIQKNRNAIAISGLGALGCVMLCVVLIAFTSAQRARLSAAGAATHGIAKSAGLAQTRSSTVASQPAVVPLMTTAGTPANLAVPTPTVTRALSAAPLPVSSAEEQRLRTRNRRLEALVKVLESRTQGQQSPTR